MSSKMMNDNKTAQQFVDEKNKNRDIEQGVNEFYNINDEDEDEDEDDEDSRKRNMSIILSKHNIIDVLKEKILDDYVLSAIDMLTIKKEELAMIATKKEELRKKTVEDEDEDETEDEDEYYDEDEDYDEDEYIRRRHELIDRKQNLVKILLKHNIDVVLIEKIEYDYFCSMN